MDYICKIIRKTSKFADKIQIRPLDIPLIFAHILENNPQNNIKREL